MNKTRIRQLAWLAAILCLSGCASVNGPPDPQDPWERFNRAMYKFNNEFDKAVLAPAAKGYRYITPDPAEKGVNNFFSNLDDVLVVINDVLQFKPRQALSDTGRFLVNSTLGIAGLFDVATPIGLKKHDEDFGQTLGRWGLGPGPYLVLPFFGLSSVRDGIGLAADLSMYPLTHVDDREARAGLYILQTVSVRAGLLEAGNIVSEAAYDPYIFLREMYLQRRQNLVYDGSPPANPADEEIDIFSDE